MFADKIKNHFTFFTLPKYIWNDLIIFSHRNYFYVQSSWIIFHRPCLQDLLNLLQLKHLMHMLWAVVHFDHVGDWKE